MPICRANALLWVSGRLSRALGASRAPKLHPAVPPPCPRPPLLPPVAADTCWELYTSKRIEQQLGSQAASPSAVRALQRQAISTCVKAFAAFVPGNHINFDPHNALVSLGGWAGVKAAFKDGSADLVAEGGCKNAEIPLDGSKLALRLQVVSTEVDGSQAPQTALETGMLEKMLQELAYKVRMCSGADAVARSSLTPPRFHFPGHRDVPAAVREDDAQLGTEFHRHRVACEGAKRCRHSRWPSAATQAHSLSADSGQQHQHEGGGFDRSDQRLRRERHEPVLCGDGGAVQRGV